MIIASLLSMPKTIYANFKYLPAIQAIRLPLFVHWNSSLSGGGRIVLHNIKPLSVRLGSADPSFPSHKLILCLTGTLEFNGVASIGSGSELIIRGHLTVGDHFSCSGGNKIDVKSNSSFGENVLIGHNCTFIDDDGHQLLQEGRIINEKRGYHIGNHVWFGRECLTLKGTSTCDNIVFGARSLINGHYNESEVVYAGSPAKIVKRNVQWVH